MSIVTDSAAEVAPMLPAASVATAVSEWTPSESVLLVIDHVPVPPVSVPRLVVPLKSSIVVPTSAVP